LRTVFLSWVLFDTVGTYGFCTGWYYWEKRC